MCKTKIINACNKTAENKIDVNEVDNEVRGRDKSRLIFLFENSEIHPLRVPYVLVQKKYRPVRSTIN